MPKTVKIIYADGTTRGEWPIDNDHIVRAAELEVELHNRDFSDDLWTVVIDSDNNDGMEES
jgi:hypothetical protein